MVFCCYLLPNYNKLNHQFINLGIYPLFRSFVTTGKSTDLDVLTKLFNYKQNIQHFFFLSFLARHFSHLAHWLHFVFNGKWTSSAVWTTLDHLELLSLSLFSGYHFDIINCIITFSSDISSNVYDTWSACSFLQAEKQLPKLYHHTGSNIVYVLGCWVMSRGPPLPPRFVNTSLTWFGIS